MRWSRVITVVGAHAEGEVGRVVTGGVLDVPGATMMDKLRALEAGDDRLRRFLLYEPRGSAQVSANLLLPPTRPEADAGFIVM
jgi:proline racemase